MKHKAQRAQEIEKSLHTTFEKALFSHQFLDLQHVRNQVKDDVKFGNCLKGHSELEQQLLQTGESWVHCVFTDAGGSWD